ncbi:MAG: hypothetical protein ACPG1C_08535 [Alphaproteobacteria bacterium]
MEKQAPIYIYSPMAPLGSYLYTHYEDPLALPAIVGGWHLRKTITEGVAGLGEIPDLAKLKRDLAQQGFYLAGARIVGVEAKDL